MDNKYYILLYLQMLENFLWIKFRFIQNLILFRRGQIYFQAKNSIRKSFIFAGVGGPHLDSNFRLNMIMISVLGGAILKYPPHPWHKHKRRQHWCLLESLGRQAWMEIDCNLIFCVTQSPPWSGTMRKHRELSFFLNKVKVGNVSIYCSSNASGELVHHLIMIRWQII